MAESFIFYRSFLDTLKKVPEPDRLSACIALMECALGDKHLESLEYPLNAIVGQMLASIKSAKKRYEQSVENGKKGGRPKIWIDRKTAERLYLELGTWEKVAFELGVSTDTLGRARSKWREMDTAKPQNPNDNVNDNENVNDSLSFNKSIAEHPAPSKPADPDGPVSRSGNGLTQAQREFLRETWGTGQTMTPEQIEQFRQLGNRGDDNDGGGAA